MVSHIVVPITGDSACLFNSLSYLMYGTEQMAREIRKLIVSHVTKNWTEFSIMSHDNNGDNYMSSAEYFADMSQLYTYVGLCELVAAGQLFHYVFEVYRNNQLYERFGIEGYPVLRMRFTQNLSRGHFDVYLPNESEILIPQRDSTLQQSPFSLSLKKDSTLQQSPLSLSLKKGGKRRARYTGNIRKKQLQNAAKTYAPRNPLVNRSAVARYQLDNPEVGRAARSRYEHTNPRRKVERLTLPWKIMVNSGMTYNHDLAYEAEKTIALGSMNHKCKYCNALKWKEETPGMCCKNGKMQLPSFEHLPEPLNSLLMDRHPHHNHFMDLIRKYNGCFLMTSFGTKKIVTEGFMPTFKVQGQDEREVRSRCANFPDVKPGLVKQLQSMLHEKNSYVKQFKTTINAVQKNCKEFKVVIRADRKPTNAHVGRFNAPTQNEIALIIGSQQFENRDIVL
ncbi:EF-Hand 1, calcium-binding site,OTU domain [Cinara cedri]|uniref:EF-Hand 1, calcium-binding site,OTU domain n=1 Tax=Cinara cedri TaxID=506608 RepID=A0A5E4NTR3_9HEMI|nr:EF-Hand 1, calcium-binding site,OTU domain [Cinara cedri]